MFVLPLPKIETALLGNILQWFIAFSSLFMKKETWTRHIEQDVIVKYLCSIVSVPGTKAVPGLRGFLLDGLSGEPLTLTDLAFSTFVVKYPNPQKPCKTFAATK